MFQLPDAANKIGVVLGNGPQIDELHSLFARRFDSAVVIGVNRICCAAACRAHDYAPDLHLVWDAPRVGVRLFDALRDGLARIEGRSWRLTSTEKNTDLYPHDQKLDAADETLGLPTAVRMVHGSTDAAANYLCRLGVREIYVFGVEMTSNEHCKLSPPIKDFDAPWLTNQTWIEQALRAWEILRDEVPGLKLYCGCRDSLLVSRGVLDYRVPLGLGEKAA